MNDIEWVMLAVVLTFQFAFMRWRKMSAGTALTVVACIFPACLLSIEYATQMMTCDDSYMFLDIINLRESSPMMWEFYKAFKTTITTVGPFIAILDITTDFTKDILGSFAKGLECFWGILLISLIVDQMHRWYAQNFPRAIFYVTAFSAIAFLPVVSLALHTINYDLLSMCLGVMAVVWLGAGLRNRNTRLITGSLIAAALASQEKLIASPVLWLCTLILAIMLTGKRGAGFISALRGSLVSLGIPIIVFVLSYLIVTSVRGGKPPSGNLLNLILQPYIFAIYPLLRLFVNGTESYSVLSSTDNASIFLSLVIFSIVVFGLAAVSMFICRFREKHFYNRLSKAILNYVAPKLAAFKFLFLLTIVITGIAATLLFRTTVSPLVPVKEGHYKPVLTWCGVALSYGAKTLGGHIAASGAWSCATFVNAFPTVILLTILFAWGISALQSFKSGHKRTTIEFTEIVAILSLFVILLFGFLQLPLSPRYMNMFYLLFLIMGGIELVHLKLSSKKVKVALTGAALILVIMEILPFRPALVTFRPYWSNMNSDFNKGPAYGQIPPWCTGWGEELVLAGKKIHKDYQKECSSSGGIRIFHNYSALWLKRPAEVDLVFMSFLFDDYEYEDCDFYIFTRTGTTFSFIPFPSQVKPIFTIGDRGVVKAWVFRARDLKAADIKFLKNQPRAEM